MLDIVVSGGTAVLPSGPEPADIGVSGEYIAAIGAPGSLAGIGAGRTIDATGQIVIPGGIDPHVHCNWPMPMPGVTQPMLTEPASRVSLAALHGGTTTTIDFAPVEGGATIQQAIERRHKQWAGACYGDYAFHTMLLGKIAPERLGELAEAFGCDLAEQHRVKGVVAVAGARPLLMPPLDRLLDRLAALDWGEVDGCRRAAMQGCEADP